MASGSYFGDVSVMLDVPISATVRAASTSMLYRLDREYFLELLRDLPKAEVYLMGIAEARFARLRLLNPQTPAAEWTTISKRRNIERDGEDKDTALYQREA